MAAAVCLSRRQVVLGAATLGALQSIGPAFGLANDYPNRPIKIVVAFAPGGGSDFIARLVAQKLSVKIGQAVIVDNRPGAGGNLGASIALKSPPDGYTLLLTAASYTVNPALYKLNFDPIKDISPVVQLARGPFLIAVNPKLPARDLKELVELARQQPGALNYGSAGAGSITHLVTEYFLDVTNTSMVHVPYRGTSPALAAAIAGDVQVVFGTVASTIPFANSGQLRVLAVSTPTRLAALSDVPTVAESGFPGYQVTNWHGIVGPKGIPADIVAKLNRSIADCLHEPGMDTGLASDGLTVAAGTPDEFGKLLATETQRWGALARKRDIKAE